MRRFSSPVTRILQLARQRQRLCELLLARAQAAEAAAQKRLEEAFLEAQAAETSLTESFDHMHSAVSLQSVQSYLAHCETQQRRRRDELQLANTAVEQARGALRAEQSKVRSLELLEERHVKVYRRDLLRHEEAQRDEQRTRRAWQAVQRQSQVTHG
jgi:flagellar export protein FliJ